MKVDLLTRLHPVMMLVVCMGLMGNWPAAVRAELVTFAFEAELVRDLGASFSLPLGQRVSGRYTFELNTPGLRFRRPTR